MNNHRPWTEMPPFDVICYEEIAKTARGRRYPKRQQIPAWNRETTIRQFRAIDRSTGGEAEVLLSAFERSFRDVFAGSPPKRERRR